MILGKDHRIYSRGSQSEEISSPGEELRPPGEELRPPGEEWGSLGRPGVHCGRLDLPATNNENQSSLGILYIDILKCI